MNDKDVFIDGRIDILIVDDDKGLCEMLEDTLSQEVEVKVASINKDLTLLRRLKKRNLILF